MNKELVLHRAQSIQGWMSDAELLFLAKCASDAKVIFEIGSFVGRSARAMADNTNGIIYCIDPWNAVVEGDNGTNILLNTDDTTLNFFYCHLADHIKSGKVKMCRSTWENYNPTNYWDKPDFIFIDGDHKYQSVINNISKAKKFIKLGGIIAGHDYSPGWPGVVSAVEEIFPLKFNLCDTIWWVNV